MFAKVFVLALAATPLVAAHGRVDVVKGNLGGNGTALGIQGGTIPLTGKNKITEPDTTVFKKVNGKAVLASDGLGKTQGQGNNKAAMIAQAMALSGSTLPQVSGDGTGTIEGTWHVVTTDGAGPIEACLDPTATGAFGNCTPLPVVQQIEGNNGNIKATKNGKRSLWERAVDVLRERGLVKRAANVNRDFAMKFSVPAGTTCSGTAGGQSNVCFVKIANNNKAGPFGGVVPIQIGSGGAAGNTTAPASTGASTKAANKKTGKRSVGFTA